MPAARRYTLPLAATGLLIGGAAVIASLVANPAPTDGWHMAARYTARASFLLFILVYLAAPLSRLVPGFRAILPERRGLGLAFAGAHFVHLGALITYLQMSGQPAALPTILLGGLAYVLLGAMALTSTDRAVRALGPTNWRRLHRFGLHYIWLVFAVTYAGRVAASPDQIEYAILLGIALLALALKLGMTFVGRTRGAPGRSQAS